MAAERLGLKTLHFDVDRSSTNKGGESLLDTLRTLEALGVDVAVIRHGEDWPALVQGSGLTLGLVNAGSGGTFDHPTQALLDALTMRQHFNRLRGISVTIVGDIRHSRVARANYNLLTKLGASVQFAGPAVFRPPEDLGEAVWVDLDEALVDTDVLMLLRVQHERHGSRFDAGTYHARYGLTEGRLERLNKGALIMHPGPVNRGVEICSAAMEDPPAAGLTGRSLTGLRCAWLYWIGVCGEAAMENWYLPNGLVYRTGTLKAQSVLIAAGRVAALGKKRIASKRAGSGQSACSMRGAA